MIALLRDLRATIRCLLDAYGLWVSPVWATLESGERGKFADLFEFVECINFVDLINAVEVKR